ncbi:DUF2789 domain-containing protein [Motiliproteus sp. MSK22-1]|uniref:DUF2789 domain-containing protein n=1 Tax=Motiliproteus sp. MSK22-1 TaxID=1897630 RepID=UPI0009767522|nr:DUF2789 domain-containing protein [Motiliproteus sp. MSK22-1]OMH38391.1 hypothetical protein BGP75_08075 [Motiliproteus sp. MSK22-1]
MDMSSHTLSTLFDQLGLPSDEQNIKKFIAKHRTQTGLDPLEGAPFWSPGQAQFLQQALTEDSDWSEVVDELNILLHS